MIMGRLDDLKAAMNGASDKMGHDLSSIDMSVLNKETASSVTMSDVQKSTTKRPPAQEAWFEERPPVDSLYNFYIRIASLVSRLSLEMLKQDELMMSQNLPDDVRKVSLESLLFIGHHFGDLIAALILNYKDIRKVIRNALIIELDLMKRFDWQRVAAHEKAGGYYFDSNDYPITLGISRYTPAIELEIIGLMRDSMSVINNTKLSQMVGAAFDTDYDQDDADDVGVLLSIPILLLVLFNNNASFVHEVSQICDALRSEYKLL